MTVTRLLMSIALTSCVCAGMLTVTGCASPQAQPAKPAEKQAETAPAPTPTDRQPANARVTRGDELPVAIMPRDRVLFLGDDLTQQRFYTRAVSSALLAMMPKGQLRFFNGGRNGATAESAMSWIDDLLNLTNPTVVFVCFGTNNVTITEPVEQVESKYEAAMTQLVQRLQSRDAVRAVVVMSMPAVSGLPVDSLASGGENYVAYRLGQAAERVAAARGAIFVDLFEHMRLLHASNQGVGGEPLVMGNYLPTEEAHVVMASVILRDIGITAAQLEPVGWSPIMPAKMRRIRPGIALVMDPPPVERATDHRDLYESIRVFDDLFFRAWRLAGPNRPLRDREDYLVQAEQAWAKIQELALTLYGSR